MEHRAHKRKMLDPIHVADIQLLDTPMEIARHGRLLNSSASGLLIGVNREDLNPELLQDGRPLASIVGDGVILKIVDMELAVDGAIARTREDDPDVYEIAIDFRDNAPSYWRECFAELLPAVGERESMNLRG